MAWVTTIARRQAIDRTRSKDYRGKDKEFSLDASPGQRGELADETSDGDASSGLRARKIKEALGKLSDSHRQLIRLSYYEGLSHSMIAKNLNTPLGTVKTRIREAVSQLRGILDIKA